MTLGSTIRDAREAARLSIESLSASTSIRIGLLNEMENNNFSHCGGDIYAKGHLRNIAPLINLEPSHLVDRYNEEHSSSARSINELLVENNVAKVPHERRTISWKVPASVSLFIVFVLGVTQIIISNVNSNDLPKAVTSPSTSPSPEATESAVVETVTPVSTGVTLKIFAARGNSLIDIVVNGEHVDKGQIFQGETKTFEATESISVYFSNPAGLDVTVNGELLSPLGGQNQEVRRTFR